MSADILAGLVAANIAASAAILIVALIRKPVRNLIGARLAYWLWLIPVLAGVAAILPARDPGAVPAPAAPIQPIAAATVDFATAWAAPVAMPAARASIDLTSAIAMVWAIGAIVFIALILLQQRRTLRALALARGDNRAANNFGPAVVGVLKPFLVVPSDFEQRFSLAERNLVLAHEDVHLAAGHTRINAALVVLTSLNWFNPLVHWAAKLSRDDQELACDATVLERFPRERGAYAEALLKTQISAQPLPLGCTWPSRSSRFFKERMTMLANKTPSRARRVTGAGFVTLAIVAAGLTAWAQKPPALPALPVLPVPELAVPELPAPVQPAPEQPVPTAPVQAAPPASVQPAPPAPRGPAIVSVDKDGHVTWNNKTVDTNEALADAARNQAASGAPSMQLSADPGTPYNLVGKVIRQAQESGIMATRFMPSGVVINTPLPPGPGSKAPAPPPIGPKGSTPPAPPTGIPDPIRVFVDYDGGIYYNGVFVGATAFDANRYVGASATLTVLEQNLKGDAKQKIPPEIHIEPHRLSSYAAVDKVIAEANKAGITLIGVIGGI